MKLTDNELKSINGGTDDGNSAVTYKVINPKGAIVRKNAFSGASELLPKIPCGFILEAIPGGQKNWWIQIPAQGDYPAGYVSCDDLKKM